MLFSFYNSLQLNKLCTFLWPQSCWTDKRVPNTLPICEISLRFHLQGEYYAPKTLVGLHGDLHMFGLSSVFLDDVSHCQGWLIWVGKTAQGIDISHRQLWNVFTARPGDPQVPLCCRMWKTATTVPNHTVLNNLMQFCMFLIISFTAKCLFFSQKVLILGCFVPRFRILSSYFPIFVILFAENEEYLRRCVVWAYFKNMCTCWSVCVLTQKRKKTLYNVQVWTSF